MGDLEKRFFQFKENPWKRLCQKCKYARRLNHKGLFYCAYFELTKEPCVKNGVDKRGNFHKEKCKLFDNE